MADELKPCPFCAKDVTEYPNDERHVRLIVHPVGHGHCPCAGKVFVMSAWNTRTETRVQATIEELVAGLLKARNVLHDALMPDGIYPQDAEPVIAEIDTILSRHGGG